MLFNDAIELEGEVLGHIFIYHCGGTVITVVKFSEDSQNIQLIVSPLTAFAIQIYLPTETGPISKGMR